MDPDCSTSTILHSTTICVNGNAVLIRGPSGSGKSALALQIMALGGTLVADDQTELWVDADVLWAKAPETLPHKIEARGVGLIPVTLSKPAQVVLAIDLAEEEKDRHPPTRTVEILEKKITVWRKVSEAHFPAAIFLYLLNMSDTQPFND